MKVVQLFTREERNLRDFAHLNAEHRDAWKMSITYDAALFSAVEFAGGITIAIVLWWGPAASRRPASSTSSSSGCGASSCRSPISPRSTRSCSRRWRASSASSSSSTARPTSAIPRPAARRRCPRRGRARGAVEFEDVWFSYQGAAARDEDWVLRDVSFRVAPGEKVAFVGATGAGKTTSSSSCTRLYEVTRGRILLDGVDLRELPQRRTAPARRDGAPGRLPVQRQRSRTTSRSAAPTSTRQAVARAARAVEAHPFVARLPRGLRDGGPRARHELLRRPAPAALLRARARARRGRARPRRGDELDRHGDRGARCSTASTS